MPANQDCDLLLDRLASHVSRQPNKRAVAFLQPGPDGGKLVKELSYASLAEETTALAAFLLNQGLKPGDRAVLVYPPSLDFMIAFLACLKAGVIAVPVFPPNPLRRETLHMFSKICTSAQAQVALTSSEYNHMKQLAGIRQRVTSLKRPTAAWPDDLKWIVTDQKRKPPNSPASFQPSSRDSTAFLQYTSGSTSDPKGVMITQNNLAHNLTIITSELAATTDTVVVSWLPQYHDMGLIGSYLGVLYCGGTGYYLSPLSFLQRPSLWIEAVSRYQATHLQAPNFAFALTARKFDAATISKDLDLACVRHVINAAEPVDEESIDKFCQTFGPFGFKKSVIFPTYGLAEHTVFVCSGGTQRLTVLKEELEVKGRVVLAENANASVGGATTTRLLGCGYPARQNVNVQIVDHETSEALTEDCVGEIWIQSGSKAAGYYQQPKETREDFHAQIQGALSSGSTAEDQGFLRTGDLGFLHKEELFICGRLKDLIIIGGRNYYPQDIEATAEAASNAFRLGCSAAFTVDPTHQGGEEVALVMELKEVPASSQIESICVKLANDVRGAVNQEHSVSLAVIAFLRPRTVPKTSSGKIARSWCRKGFLADTLTVVYRKSFKTGVSPLELEQANGKAAPAPAPRVKAEEIRAMSKEEILEMLKQDVSRVASVPVHDIDKKAALVTMMDSLTISQFQGMLESNYSVRLVSEDYLFRESTSLTKLVEVVKLGYAPDDNQSGTSAPTSSTSGQAKGLAGALGCPPGVRCTIL